MNQRPETPAAVTALINKAQVGDEHAAEHLLQLVYEQLRTTAGSFFRQQAANHTLQPTALVHEVYIKLLGNPDKQWEGRAHFCAVASMAMRHILRDHARAKRAAKRHTPGQLEAVTQLASPSRNSSLIDLLALQDALWALSGFDERGARVVEMHFFGGLTNVEIAGVLNTSPSTIDRALRRSLAWIHAELSD